MTAPRRFRWGQFSIRTVLLLTFGVACYFGGWAARQWQYEREMEAAARAAEAEMAAAAASFQNALQQMQPALPRVPPGLPPGYPGAASDAAPAIGEYGIGGAGLEQPPTDEFEDFGPTPAPAADAQP